MRRGCGANAVQMTAQRKVGWLLGVALLLAGCTLEASRLALTPIPTPDIPRVEFLFPDNNSVVLENTDLTLDIIAYDETAGVARVEVRVDGELLLDALPPDAIPVSPFRFETNWLAQGLSRHVIAAVAYRTDGTPSAEALLILDVQPRP